MWRKIANKSLILSRNWQKYLFLISTWNCMGHSSSAPMAFQTPPIVLSPKGRHTATVIFLHGLGDTGHGWSVGFQETKNEYTKFIFPTANQQKVTLNGGMMMPSWFDIRSLSLDAEEDEAGIVKSSDLLMGLIETEEQKHGIKPERIVIGGFSQGGAVALHAAITSGKKFGGLLALSCWVPLHKKLEREKCDVSILQCHGNADPVVNFTYGQMSAAVLKKVCADHTFKTYQGLGHSSSPQEMKDVAEFLKQRLPPV